MIASGSTSSWRFLHSNGADERRRGRSGSAGGGSGGSGAGQGAGGRRNRSLLSLRGKGGAGAGERQPVACYLHSTTQIGSNVLLYGGSSFGGAALRQMFVFHTEDRSWAVPEEDQSFVDDEAGPRYGHTAIVLEMHPPRVLFFGGMVGGDTFTFGGAAPAAGTGSSGSTRVGGGGGRKGTTATSVEEADNSVFVLECGSTRWSWTKPLVHGKGLSGGDRPDGRTEHTAVKISSVEVAIFGGWIAGDDGSGGPTNELWTLNYAEWEWVRQADSGIKPRPRYRHCAEVVGGAMIVLGGSDNAEDDCRDAEHLGVHVLDVATMSWTHPTVRGASPFPRSGHCTAVSGAHSIAIFGGRRDPEEYFDDLWMLDTAAYSFTQLQLNEPRPTAVTSATMHVVGNVCFVFGGTDARGKCYNDVRFTDVGWFLDESDITVMEGAKSDFNFKIIVIGDTGVGKSSLLTRFAENVFMDSFSQTIGVDFNSRMIRVEGRVCKLDVWDTAGQERFSAITTNYYRSAQGALLVYDVCSRESFEHVQNWYERARQLGGDKLVVILIGNKVDVEERAREVSTEDGQALADSLDIEFLETSAMAATNVEAAFVAMTKRVKALVEAQGLAGLDKQSLKQGSSVSLAERDRGQTGDRLCCA